MGATEEQGEEEVISIDKPIHPVAVPTFYIGQTEVTNRLWEAVMAEQGTKTKEQGLTEGEIWEAADCPVVLRSWFECQEFIRRLDSITGVDFRLPSEAEWEYAARGGAKAKITRYAGSDKVDEVGWLYLNSGNRVHAVAQKKPNELGLYDMTGNVWEWCINNFYPYEKTGEVVTYTSTTADTAKVLKVMRGGSWDNAVSNSHLSVRRTEYPQYAFHDCGLRLVLSKKVEPAVLPQTKKVRIKGHVINFDLVMPEDSINPYDFSSGSFTFFSAGLSSASITFSSETSDESEEDITSFSLTVVSLFSGVALLLVVFDVFLDLFLLITNCSC